MKRLLLLLVLLLVWLGLPAQTNDLHSRPRVGVVLSGGGAKGMAHVGVLKAIEESGIPIDYIAGTSMGAIVGGLYAMGYTPAQLDTLLRSQDWDSLLSDKPMRSELSPGQREMSESYILSIPLSSEKKSDLSGLVRGVNLGNYLAQLTVGMHDSISFDSLPIPFACVATNLATGEEVVLREGIVSKAIRASMAIPGVFTPVIREGKTLVDGGLVNNFPVDVARRMGADIVIGSTVQSEFSDTVEFSSVTSILFQFVDIACRAKYEQNVADCDLCIAIDTKGISMLDFTEENVDLMVRRGYETTLALEEKLREIKALVNVAGGVEPQARPELSISADPVYEVRHVIFESVSPSEERLIRRACGLKDSSEVSMKQIDGAVQLLSQRFLFLEPNYSLVEIDSLYDLTFHADKRSASRVDIGARFDTEELATVMLNTDIIFHTSIPSSLDITLRLTEQYGGKISFTVEPALNRQLNLYYSFRHREFDVKRKGKKFYNLDFHEQQAGFSFAYRQVRNIDYEMGIQVQCFNFDEILQRTDLDVDGAPTSDTYFTGFARLYFNSQDRSYFPSRGSKFCAIYSFTTDNLTKLQRPHGFSTVSAYWETVIPFASKWAFQPKVAGRLVLTQDVPYVFRNAIGGLEDGKYFGQQLSFVGLSYVETVRNSLAMFNFRIRYLLRDKQYVSLLGNLACEERDVKHLFKGNVLYGVGAQYAYDSKFGPVSATFAYSGRRDTPVLYINVGYVF